MSPKEELHRLVDRLPEGEAQAAQRFLEYLCDFAEDPFLAALRNAPEDDEPTTPEEDQAVEEAWRDCQAGKARPWEKVRKELAGE
jgi:hypothetical protein